jgi:hypothetical protein
MSRWIRISNGIISNIRVAIERLRVGGTGNDRIRLEEAVNIRRTRLSIDSKKVVKEQMRCCAKSLVKPAEGYAVAQAEY